jgi:signal peptidase I
MAVRPSLITIVRRLIDGVLVVLIVGVLVGIGLGRLLPMVGHPTLIVGGPSMEPSLPLGSLVVLDPVTSAEIRPGDVVTLRVAPGAAPYTHRVSRLLTIDGQPYLETKGDANRVPDPATVPASAVTGRVAVGLPWLGYLLALLTMPVGVAFVLGLGSSLVLAAALLESIDEPARHAGPVATARAVPKLEGPIARHLATTPRRDRRAFQRPR